MLPYSFIRWQTLELLVCLGSVNSAAVGGHGRAGVFTMPASVLLDIYSAGLPGSYGSSLCKSFARTKFVFDSFICVHNA